MIYGVGTRKSAVVKDEAARLLAAIPDDGNLFQWTRALVCKEDSGSDFLAGKVAGTQVKKQIRECSRNHA